MKHLLSKEHYYYNTHTSLMETSASPLPLYRQPSYVAYLPHFYKKILIPASMIFHPPSINKRGGGDGRFTL